VSGGITADAAHVTGEDGGGPAQKTGDLAPLTGSMGGLLALLGEGGQSGGLAVPKPFSQPVRLIDAVAVAGTTHVPGIERIAAGLHPGDRLRFERDPGNAHDARAVKVFSPGGERVGWLPVDVNDIPARLMDAGKELYGSVVDVERRGSWTRIRMDVYLDD
jgi:hypothetical protein